MGVGLFGERDTVTALSGALSLIVLINVQNVAQVRMPLPLLFVARCFGIQQWWGVFAPRRDEY